MPQDPGSQDARAHEAKEIAARREAELREQSYEALVASYLDRTVRDQVVGSTGSAYDVEVEAFWETRGRPGTLVVHVIVGWPQRGSRSPALQEFLVASDGHIVSEREPQWFRELDYVRRPIWYVFLYPAATATLAWIIWGHGSTTATSHLVRGLATAAYIAIVVAARRSWVRRRRRISATATTAGINEASSNGGA